MTSTVQVSTEDRDQAERCKQAGRTKAPISETFGTQQVSGRVHAIVEPKHGDPRTWRITFVDATTEAT